NHSAAQSSAAIDLVLDGVDTIGQVGENNLTVSLTSPIVYARQAAENYASKFGYPVPPDCPPLTYNGECYFNFIRKPAYSFSWDWGPAVPTSGLWRAVYLDLYSGLAIDYVKFTASPSLDSSSNAWWAMATAGVKFGDRFDQKIGQINPHLWWPNGYGSQRLYTLRVRLCLDGPDCRLLDNWETRQVAFRQVQLLQNSIGNELGQGLNFNLVVNNRPVFIKGSNFVPIGMSIPGADVSDYDWLMRSAAAAGINMLRVWGGGTIERAEFYDLADQLGIMIWQDFPFACALYPTDEAFLSTVRSEVRATVRRLQHRASLAVWVGNNENEGALANDWWSLWANQTERYYDDYRKLYMRLVRQQVVAEDSTRLVLLSSPSNGDATEWEGGIAHQPQSTLFGDVHFYSYTEDMWLPETTPLARLMSEFGFQSHPSLITVLSATRDPRNIGIDTNFTLHREHQPNGTLTIARHNARHFASQVPKWLIGVNDDVIGKLLVRNFSVPSSELKQLTDRLATYAYQSYASQIDQAEIYRRITHQHAFNRCRLRSAANQARGLEGMSSGVMYWQLNDVWSAPTWSSIEVTGAWKATHYYAARYYANRRLAIALADSEQRIVEAFYIRDSNPNQRGSEQIEVRFDCYDVDSLARLNSWTIIKNST
uniref:beta-mannosidase n=1 Tax=Macrostomum lignano TaxID=282301 RepID=A0A1I8IDR0_9PLAT